MNLENKIALVTGGSQGLGEQITRVLSETGATVIIGDIQKDKAEFLAKQLDNVEAMKLDVSQDVEAKQIFKDIEKKYGTIDILINNAGIDITKSIEELSAAEFQKVVQVNLIGPFMLSKYALEVMKKHKSGHIVNIASTAALRSWANASAYHASKWGLRGMSHGLYVEAREFGIKVSTIVAGGMQTPFILERFPDTPLDKLQDPRNVAETVKFVLTMAAESIIPEVMVLPLNETSWP